MNEARKNNLKKIECASAKSIKESLCYLKNLKTKEECLSYLETLETKEECLSYLEKKKNEFKINADQIVLDSYSIIRFFFDEKKSIQKEFNLIEKTDWLDSLHKGDKELYSLFVRADNNNLLLKLELV